MCDDKKSYDLVFDVMQKEYDLEDARNKNLETKVQIMLAVSGIILSAIFLLGKIVVESKNCLFANGVLLIISSTLTIYAMFELLNAIKIKIFRKLDHNRLTNSEIIKMKEVDLKEKLIHDYHEAIEASITILKTKTRLINHSSNMLEVSVLVMGVVFVIIVLSSN